MELVTANVSGKARRVTRGGREYFVADMTLIVPGVLKGSKGALYYPDDEVAKGDGIWNGQPLTVNHPTDPLTNEVLSANDQGVLDRQGIGFVEGDKWDDKAKRRRAQGWFDIEKTRKISPTIYNRLVKNDPIELSTGLFTENEELSAPGNHNGTLYNSIARNYRPDHVAILPDQKGACSMSDGCGVLVNQAFEITDNEFSSDEQRQAYFGMKASGEKQASAKASHHKEVGEFHRAEAKKAEKDGRHIAAEKHTKAAEEHEAEHKKLAGNLARQPRHVETKRFQPYKDTHKAAEIGAIHLTASDRLFGKDASQQLKDTGHNPASWVEDEDAWQRAKKAADKGGYEQGSPTYYAVVTHIYKNMGGAIKPTNNLRVDNGWVTLPNGTHIELGESGEITKGPQIGGGDKKEAPKAEGKEKALSTEAIKASKFAGAASTVKAHKEAELAHKNARDAYTKAGDKARAKGHDTKMRKHEIRKTTDNISMPTMGAGGGDTGGSGDSGPDEPSVDPLAFGATGGGESFAGTSGAVDNDVARDPTGQFAGQNPGDKALEDEASKQGMTVEELKAKMGQDTGKGGKKPAANCGGMEANAYDGNHYTSKEAATQSLRTEHDGAFKHAQAAMKASKVKDSKGAADSHIKAAEAHETAATEARKKNDGEAAYENDRAAALHRKAASIHTATPSQAGAVTNQGDPVMAATREQMLARLTANCNCDKDKAAFNSLSDATLNALFTKKTAPGKKKGQPPMMDDEDQEDEEEPEFNADGSKAEGSNATATGSGTTQAGGKGTKDEYDTGVTTTNAAKAWLEKAPPEVAAVFNHGLQQMQNEKVRIVRHLTANSTGEARKAAIQVYHKMGLPELRLLAAASPMAPTQNSFIPVPEADPVALYYGAAGMGNPLTANTEGSDDKDLVLESATLNFSEISAANGSNKKTA